MKIHQSKKNILSTHLSCSYRWTLVGFSSRNHNGGKVDAKRGEVGLNFVSINFIDGLINDSKSSVIPLGVDSCGIQ